MQTSNKTDQPQIVSARRQRSPLPAIVLAAAFLSLGLSVWGGYLHIATPQTANKSGSTPEKPRHETHRHGKATGKGQHEAGSVPAPVSATPSRFSQADILSYSGAGGLFLCVLAGLGLARQQRLTQFRTTQSYLAAERSAWEKQRSAYDAQRDQLIAELQQAQKHKAELDTLRQHGSRQFEDFFRTLPVACFCVTSTGKILRWNAASETLYGITAAEAQEKLIWDSVIPAAEREHMQAQMTRVLGGESLLEIERRDTHADGSVLQVRGSMVPLRDAAGQMIGCLSANFGVTDLKQLEQQIESQRLQLQKAQSALEAAQSVAAESQQRADGPPVELLDVPSPNIIPQRDAVTGLPTQEEFQEHLNVEFERAARYHNALSLVLLDLDGFAAYNQAHGSEVGDETLRSVAEMLRTKVRNADIIARSGPDEFAILLPETGPSGALIAAQRFRSGVASLATDTRMLTASLSIATLSPEMPHPAALVARATETLRASARSGPNRIVGADHAAHEEAAAALQSVRTRKRS